MSDVNAYYVCAGSALSAIAMGFANGGIAMGFALAENQPVDPILNSPCTGPSRSCLGFKSLQHPTPIRNSIKVCVLVGVQYTLKNGIFYQSSRLLRPAKGRASHRTPLSGRASRCLSLLPGQCTTNGSYEGLVQSRTRTEGSGSVGQGPGGRGARDRDQGPRER